MTWRGVEVSVYCIQMEHDEIDEDDISIMVDNERFVDPDVKAQVLLVSRTEIIASFAKSSCKQMIPPNDNGALSLIFIYGSRHDKTRKLYENILQGVLNLNLNQQSKATATTDNNMSD